MSLHDFWLAFQRADLLLVIPPSPLALFQFDNFNSTTHFSSTCRLSPLPFASEGWYQILRRLPALQEVQSLHM